MPFLSQVCVDHGEIARTGTCCSGLTAWGYDANTGQKYDTFGCWWATCADAGQYAPPAGTQPGCCPGLVPVNGKCTAPINQPGCATVGKVPLAGQACCSGLVRDATGVCNTPQQGGGLFDSIDSATLMMIGGGLLLLMMLGKKR